MSAAAEWDLGSATALEAEAIGPAGQRRFRLRVSAGDVTASIWCEKEQVNSLATAVQQSSRASGAREKAAGRPRPSWATSRSTRPTNSRPGGSRWATDEDARTLSLFATDIETDADTPTLRVDFSREIARRFTVQAETAVAGGRPTCPLCKQPLEEDEHLCPQTNGHGDGALAGIGPPEF